MNCVPGQTLLICAAALAFNAAAASAIDLTPAELFLKSSAGETPFVFGAPLFFPEKAPRNAALSPAAALNELAKGNREEALSLLRRIAADEKNPRSFQARLLAGPQ